MTEIKKKQFDARHGMGELSYKYAEYHCYSSAFFWNLMTIYFKWMLLVLEYPYQCDTCVFASKCEYNSSFKTSLGKYYELNMKKRKLLYILEEPG